MPKEAIKTLVPAQVYTDRKEFLDYFYNYALKAIPRRATSTVLLGQRRMGKTEIFKRVVNRLFFEQDHTDPKALVPVYYSFRDTIKDILIRLSRGDLLEYMELGGWFRKINDPILLDFLKAWGRFEVEGHSFTRIKQDTVKQYNRLKRQVSDQKGYIAEVYLTQILWNARRKTFPGQYFNQPKDITFPHQFYNIQHRLRLDASANSEVDVYAFADREIWVCESKWWQTKKVGIKVVENFLIMAEKVKDFEGREYFDGQQPFTLKLWLFAHNGVTNKAKKLLEKHNIYWSTKADLEALIKLAGLRPLPTELDN